MKHLALLSLLVLLLCCSTTKTANTKVNETIDWIGFNWVAAEISGQSFPKAGIEIPVELNGLDRKLALQLDIGSQQTFLNENSIRHLQPLDQSLATINTVRYDRDNFDLVIRKAVVTSLKGTELKRSVVVAPQEGEVYDSADTTDYLNIGTLGADAFAGKLLVIDYPGQRFAVVDSLPEEFAVIFVPTTVTYGKLNLPVTFRGRTVNLLFDTGASIFEIATTPAGYQTLNGGAPTTSTLEVPSFGTMLEFVGAQSTTEVNIGSLNLKHPFVYYSDNENVIGFFEESDIFGLTGNALFLDKVVVVDYKNGRFGVKQ